MIDEQIAELEQKMKEEEALLKLRWATLDLREDYPSLQGQTMQLREIIEQSARRVLEYQRQLEDLELQKQKGIETEVNLKLLDEALREAFDRFDLERVLAYELDVRLNEIVEQSNFSKVVFSVIEYFRKRDELEKLIAIAYKERPNNIKLHELAEKHPYHGA